jgi:UDP-N-acetylmuramoyl-L-alanyl-D-glutamate--2,6-diaminopimelate ligase
LQANSLGNSSLDDPTIADGQLSLQKILPTSRFFSGNDVVFTSIAESAETAEQGELVVYRIGQDCPSKLIADAMARGAAGILTEQVLPCPLPQCIVGDIELAMASITAESLDHPDRKMLTIGVVGSAGKTTTALLVSSLLRASGIRTAYQTDLGESDGIVQLTSSTSLPVNAPLVEWLSEADDSQCKAAIVEISEDEARRGHYDAIKFDMVVVTGSATCSGDFGPSGLQCVLERLTHDGVIVAPVDDEKTIRVARDCGANVVTYGVRKSADVTAKIIDQSGGMTTLLVTHHDTTAVMETSLCGAGMAANHAASISVGMLVGQPLHEVVEKLSQLRSIPGRGQRLESFAHAAVVLDAGGSPDRVTTTLRTFRSMKSAGRLWCVLAIDGSDSPEVLARYGNLIERFADNAIVTAVTEGNSSFLKASHAILDGVEKCAAFRLVANRRRAIEWAISEARPNDTILFITGEKNQAAHAQRSDLERISGWVDSAREPNDEPVKLKVFQ